MALLFCDSFDHYATAQITRKWTSSGSASISAGGRNSTNALTFGDYNQSLSKVFSNYSNFIIGTAISPGAGTGTTLVNLISFIDTASIQISLAFNTVTRVLVVYRGGVGGTVLATGTTILNAGAYYYIEFKGVINGTTGSFEVRVNGVTEVSGTNVNTQATANSFWNLLRIFAASAGTSGSWAYDDLYLCDNSGSQNNNFLGDIRVQAILPTGAGTTTQWTPSTGANYTAVDESTPNDDTDYVSSATVGQIDTYAMGDLISSGGTVAGIQQLYDVRKDDAGTRQIAPVLHIGGSDYVGANLPSLSTSYQYLSNITELSPATGVPFTISEVNGMESGQKVIA